jgi:hypothetical protein
LAIHALARVAEVQELAIHAPARVAEVEALAIHALARVAEVQELAHAVLLDDLPGALAGTKARANPAAQAPTPPAGNLGVVIVGVAFEPRLQAVLDAHEPGVAGVQVVFVGRPIGVMGDRFRIGSHRAPEIGDQSV